MNPATRPPERRDGVRLLVVDRRSGAWRDATFADLGTALVPGDLLVVNDAATLPASLAARGPSGTALELRLVAGPSPVQGRWQVVVFGPGDWRTPTERRDPPQALSAGDVIHFSADLSAVVTSVSPRSPRLLEILFDRSGEELWPALYSAGRPIQYSYLTDDLDLWSVQTVFAARPWAMEMPSAGRPFTWQSLGTLRRRGIGVVSLTHAAGLSSTGDATLDALLPLPERYDLPAATVAAIHAAHQAGRRVIAVGTTVVRALEGCHQTHGCLVAGTGVTDLVLGPDQQLHVVDGLVTGMHEPTESHYRLLTAFVPEPALRAAVDHARALGYQAHELGDLTLVL